MGMANPSGSLTKESQNGVPECPWNAPAAECPGESRTAVPAPATDAAAAGSSATDPGR